MWLPLTRPLLGTWPTTQVCALTGNQTSDPLVHRRVGVQSTEPHQPGLALSFCGEDCTLQGSAVAELGTSIVGSSSCPRAGVPTH